MEGILMKFRINRNTSTFFKYLVSYILIFTVLMFCFFLILRNQLTESYAARQNDRIVTQIEAAANHLSTEIQFLTQIDNLITRNTEIILSTYSDETKYWHITHRELQQYASSSSLIDTIVYYSHYNNYVFASKGHILYSGGCFSFTNSAMKQTIFDPAAYLDASAGQLIYLNGVDSQYLLWFPTNPSRANYIYFYLLDTQVIHSQLSSLLSNEVLAVALLDEDGNYVTGSGFGPYEASVEGVPPTKGVLSLDPDTAMYISKTLHNGFTLAAVVSENLLRQQVNDAFIHAYLSLLFLSLFGIMLVYVAMQFTYRPLHQLVKNLGHNPQSHQNYLELISRNHRELLSQKAELEQTLSEYRETLAHSEQADDNIPDYPHEELGSITACLREKRFADVKNHVDHLLSQPGSASGYFLGYIALDCLTVISNSMNRSKIDFESYADAYSQALHRCRNIHHSKDLDTLKELIGQLLEFYEQKHLERIIQAEPLKQYVESRFRDPVFSITELAEKYHMNTSRMSNMFKTEVGIGFLDYVWKLRLEKAQQLLLETDLSVDEISKSVGYLSSTSFGRKFKQETKLTPSQYRAQTQQTEP